MAYYRSKLSEEDLLPKIRNLGINDSKRRSNVSYIDDGDSTLNSVTELWRDRPSSGRDKNYSGKKKSPKSRRKHQKAWATSSTSSDSRASSPVPRWISKEFPSDVNLIAERNPYGMTSGSMYPTAPPALQYKDYAPMLSGHERIGDGVEHYLAHSGEGEEAKDRVYKLMQERDGLSMQLSHFRDTADIAQSDLAAERVKCRTMQEEIGRGQQKISELEQKIIDLKCEVETSRQSYARQEALVNSLQQRVRDAEGVASDREHAMTRTGTAVNSLRKELQMQQDKRQELESSLKLHLSIEDENSKKAELWEKKYRELCATVGTALSVDASPMTDIGSVIINRVNDIVREGDVMKQRMNSLVHSVQNNDIEAKASRETIMRLVADMGKEQKTSGERLSQVESLTRERDTALQKCRELELEVQNGNDQLSHCQDALNSSRKQLLQKEERIMNFESDSQKLEQTQHHLGTKLRIFRSKIAELLSVPDYVVEDSEESILRRLKGIRKSLFDLSSVEGKLHSHVRTLAEELNSQKNLQENALYRANNAEAQLHGLTTRVKELEGELIAGDVEREKLREERRRYTAFLERLTHAMKLNEIALEVGLDLNADAIIVRAEQLAKSESETVQDRTSQVYNLQRKLKGLKQQAESKDLQASIMKKRLGELEEILKDKSKLENERGDVTTQNFKLKRHNERLQEEVQQLRGIVTELKAKLMEASELKVITVEQKQMIDELEGVINKLAKSKHKTVKQLAEIKQELDFSAKGNKMNIKKRPEYYEQIEEELNSTKEALEGARKREKQLCEFRAVLASLIGLDINALTVPDYEIISRIERLVQGHHEYSLTSRGMDTMLSDKTSPRLYRPFTGTV